jgi:serine protease Do
VERGFMGVNISKVTKELKSLYTHKKGAIITDVQYNSPAQKAELKRGDLIYAINGKDVKNPHDLQQIVTSFRPHETIKLAIERDGKEIDRELKLGNVDGEELALSSIDKNFEGLYINRLNDTNREKFGIPATIAGVVIEKVDTNSQSYIDGFSAGDIIIQIENLNIETLGDATKAFKQYKGITKRIYINRRGAIMLVVTK